MRIDHVALYCKDLERMKNFFIKYFDARSNEQYHNPRTGLRTYILTFPDGDARLELMQRPDTIDVDPSKPNIGFIHLSFSLGSRQAVDEKTKELQHDGFTIVSGPSTTGDCYYETAFLGPEEIQMEITAD